MTAARIVRGVGRAANPVDGDRIMVELGIRDDHVAVIGAEGIRTGTITWIGVTRTEIWFKSGAEARKYGETFAGCETARRAALSLFKVFRNRSVDEALRMGVGELLAQMETEPGDVVSCVATVLEAVRNAVIDVQLTKLAEAIVEARKLSA